MADAKNTPQILQHVCKSLTCTIYDTIWIPSSARFVLLGSTARTTGSIQIYELQGNDILKLDEVEKQNSFKCGTFGASDLIDRQLATGDFKGNLQIWDLERLYYPIFSCKAHESIINAIDGIGGSEIGYGAPEIVTGARDGRVCVWDPRQRDDPVAAFEPKEKESVRDCWAVAFGNSYNDEERCVAAGYDNGDVKLFDLRAGKIRWQTSLRNGICGIEFDRKDIKMNKLVATTLEANFHVYDMRTHHPEKGYASLSEKASHGTTVWGVRHLPQNREVFMTLGGDGSLTLYKYSYPDQRYLKDSDGRAYGVMGHVNLLSTKTLSTQPISAFHWSPDKEGLAVMGSFDQCVSIMQTVAGHFSMQARELNDAADFATIAKNDRISICGFGSLLSERSARSTFPKLQNFRVGVLRDFRRIFAHVAPVFFERGIANVKTKEMSSLSVEPCTGEAIVVTIFDISLCEVPSFIEREHEFRFLAVNLESSLQSVICSKYSDEEYLRIRCKGDKNVFHERYGRYGIQKIWRDDILPCRLYLRHCVLASKKLGEEAYSSFVDHTYLGDRQTNIRQYLDANQSIMDEQPPAHLLQRYGG